MRKEKHRKRWTRDRRKRRHNDVEEGNDPKGRRNVEHEKMPLPQQLATRMPQHRDKCRLPLPQQLALETSQRLGTPAATGRET